MSNVRVLKIKFLSFNQSTRLKTARYHNKLFENSFVPRDAAYLQHCHF